MTLLEYIVVIILGSIFIGFAGYMYGGLSYAIVGIGAFCIAAIVLICILGIELEDNTECDVEDELKDMESKVL